MSEDYAIPLTMNDWNAVVRAMRYHAIHLRQEASSPQNLASTIRAEWNAEADRLDKLANRIHHQYERAALGPTDG